MQKWIANRKAGYSPAISHILRVKRSGAGMERRRDDERIKDGIRVSLGNVYSSLVGLDRKRLHILGGFSVVEISSALVSSQAAIEKRLSRGKKTLARSKKLFNISGPAKFSSRLPAVHTVLYFLFNEGYHGANSEFAVRTDPCREAMRLTATLLEHPLCATPPTYALAAPIVLQCRPSARATRYSRKFEFVIYQDRSTWDRPLISEGRV